VHRRDIKPDNIMLDKWLTLKIGDFGFARAGHQEKGFKSILVCMFVWAWMRICT
jgi:hypothetical protein